MTESVEVLVGTGSFKVDRSRALEKLMKFQLPDPHLFVLPLVRCAAASGAKRIAFKLRGIANPAGRMNISFDGEPFSERDLRDPFSCLLEKRSADTARHRDLAVGLLSAWRLDPHYVSVASGRGPGRREVRMRSLDAQEMVISEEDCEETLINVPVGLWGASGDKIRTALARHCLACPLEIIIDGESLPLVPGPHSLSMSFETGGVRGWIAVPADPSQDSVFQGCRHGVLAGPVIDRLPLVQVFGLIDNPLLTLNASQTGVARNAQFRKTMTVVSGQAERLMGAALEDQRERLSQVGRWFKHGRGHGAWSERMERGSAVDRPSVWRAMAQALGRALGLEKDEQRENESIRTAARAACWLREAALRLLPAYPKNVKEPALRGLRTQPLLFDVRGDPLSLEELGNQLAAVGFVPVSRSFFPGSPVLRTAWLASSGDLELLAKSFPDALRDVGAGAPRGGPPSSSMRSDGAKAAMLEDLGYPSLLIRDKFSGEGFEGEVALPLQPPESKARIYLIEPASPRLSAQASELFFVAAAKGGTTPEPPDLHVSVVSAAEELYRRLGQEYNLTLGGARTDAVREYLLHYLCWARGRSPAEALSPGHAWIEGVRLFETGMGWVNFAQLQGDYQRGGLLAAAESQSAAAGLTATLLLGRRHGRPLLEKLFPDAAFLPAPPGSPGLLLFVKPAPSLSCQHASVSGCLVALEDGVHLAVGAAGQGQSVDLPWGTVQAFEYGLGGTTLAKSDFMPRRLREDRDTGLRVLAAVIERLGTLVDKPEHPARRLILRALGHWLAPWHVRASPNGNRLDQLLLILPMFQRPAGVAASLGEIERRMSLGTPIPYQLRDSASRVAAPELILGKEEIAALELLFPKGARSLTSSQKPEGPAAVVLAAPLPPPEPVTVPAPMPELPPFGEMMLFERRYEHAGLRARLALPKRLRPASVQLLDVRSGRGLPLQPKGLPVIGAALIDLSLRPDPSAVPDESEVLELFRRFALDLIQAWPVAAHATRENRVAVLYVLELAALLVRSRPEGWEEVETKILALRLFSSLGLDPVSLAMIPQKISQLGELVYAATALFPVPPEARGIPILSRRERAGIDSVLSRPEGPRWVLYHPPPPPVKPEPRAPARPKPAPAAAPPAHDPEHRHPMVVRLRKILSGLRGRKGMRVLNRELRWEELGRRRLLSSGPMGIWVVGGAHDWARLVLESGLPSEAQVAYLASLLQTAANREAGEVTDLDDALFQEALAEKLAREGQEAG